MNGGCRKRAVGVRRPSCSATPGTGAPFRAWATRRRWTSGLRRRRRRWWATRPLTRASERRGCSAERASASCGDGGRVCCGARAASSTGPPGAAGHSCAAVAGGPSSVAGCLSRWPWWRAPSCTFSVPTARGAAWDRASGGGHRSPLPGRSESACCGTARRLFTSFAQPRVLPSRCLGIGTSRSPSSAPWNNAAVSRTRVVPLRQGAPRLRFA